MVRLLTFFMFLLILFIVVCVYFYNSLISAEYSVSQGLKDLELYFTERLLHAEHMKKTLGENYKKELTTIIKGYKDAQESNEKIITDNKFSELISLLIDGKKIPKNSKDTLNALVLLEESVGSKKRFVDGKTNFYNERIKTFPSSIIAQIFKKKELTPFILTGEETNGIDPDSKV